jgi:hypothetical protein
VGKVRAAMAGKPAEVFVYNSADHGLIAGREACTRPPAPRWRMGATAILRRTLAL